MTLVKKDSKYELAKITKANFEKLAKNAEEHTSVKGKGQPSLTNTFMENNLNFHILYARFLLFSCFKLSRMSQY